MKVTTNHFGMIDLPDDSIVTFPSGLIGFHDLTRFALLENAKGLGYQILQCVDDGNLAFVVVEPSFIKGDYSIDIQDDALAELEFEQEDPLGLFCLVTIPPGQPEGATANLRGPLVVNFRSRRGKQVVLNESFPIRYAFLSPEALSATGSSESAREVVQR